MEDMDAKGRRVSRLGHNHVRAKLTEDAVRLIRQMFAAKVPQRQIARQFGVDKNVVYCILKGKTWKHVV